MDDDTRLAHLAAIIEGSDDAIASKDLRGIIQTWNPAAERIFGFTAKEAIGNPMTIIFPRDRLAEEETILATISRGERIDHYETIRVRKDGTPLDISVTVSPIRDRTGRVVGASKIARNVTERKRIERELRVANERLRRVDEERKAFLNLVAHELRTPLTPIKLQLELMRQAAGREPVPSQDVERIERHMERLSSLVEQVLALARMESGRIPLRLDRMDLSRLIDEAIEIFRPAAQQANVQLVAVGPRPLPLRGDADRLMQIFTNLISNAIKFTPAHGRIEVRTSTGGSDVLVEVADTGHGFDPSRKGELFHAFSRLNTTKPGTGLGLYISQAIARQHGGEITAQSAGANRGSTFSLRLPTDPKEASASVGSPPPIQTASIATIERRMP